MAKYEDIIKGFHRVIENLNDDIDARNRELQLLDIDRIDSLKPAIIASKISCTVAEMLSELLDFEKAKGKTIRTESSKKRLIALLEDTEQLNCLSTSINKLKLFNTHLFGEYQVLKAENLKLKEQIQRSEDAVSF